MPNWELYITWVLLPPRWWWFPFPFLRAKRKDYPVLAKYYPYQTTLEPITMPSQSHQDSPIQILPCSSPFPASPFLATPKSSSTQSTLKPSLIYSRTALCSSNPLLPPVSYLNHLTRPQTPLHHQPPAPSHPPQVCRPQPSVLAAQLLFLYLSECDSYLLLPSSLPQGASTISYYCLLWQTVSGLPQKKSQEDLKIYTTSSYSPRQKYWGQKRHPHCVADIWYPSPRAMPSIPTWSPR